MTENRMREWLTWKVLLPFFFLILMWPIYSVLNHLSISEAFHHAFSHCELLIFSSLVFIEIAIEIGYLEKTAREGMEWWPDVARVLAFVSVFFYGIIVADVIRQAQEAVANPKLSPDPYHGQLTLYSIFACSVAIFAVSTSIYTFWKVKQIELARRTRRAREPKRRQP